MSAVSDYFRTALLIDDRVAADYRALEEIEDGSTSRSYEEPSSGLVEPPAEDETPVHPSTLVRSFLASGVVCSVLETEEEPSAFIPQVLQGAQIADLLILDWLMPRANPMTIKAIDAVTTKHRKRLTVIVVFTGVQSLSGVVQRLADEIGFEIIDDFVVRRDNTVALVFGKPGLQLTGGEDRRQPDDCYRELPKMIFDDLDLIFRGLMPEFAFSSINTLRESAPRVLATFNAELDVGALIHRVLLPNPDDAATQFIRLLCSDMELALRGVDVSRVWDVDASSEALARATADGNASPLAGRLRNSPTVTDDLKALDNDDLVKRAIAHGLAQVHLGDSAISKVVGDVEAAMVDSRTSSENLAILMDSSSFGETPPRLELGVVVLDEHDGYWLCIQPLCDSVRLMEERAFPMIPIRIRPRKPTAMIRSPKGEALPVAFDLHPYMLRLVEFAPSDGGVCAKEDTSGWCFTDVEENRYLAVTRLRQEFATQAVQGFISTIARVGADPSEWLRRKA